MIYLTIIIIHDMHVPYILHAVYNIVLFLSYLCRLWAPRILYNAIHINTKHELLYRGASLQLIEYLNFAGSSSKMFLARWDISNKLGFAPRTRYSTSPVSPANPMFLDPYPRGLAGPALCFSELGLLKNLRLCSSASDMVSRGTLWLMTLKKP